VGSKPGSSQFHVFSHFHHFTAEPQRLPLKQLLAFVQTTVRAIGNERFFIQAIFCGDELLGLEKRIQGCQMVNLHTKNAYFGFILECLEMETLGVQTSCLFGI
jgi:hypothetical protein